MKSIELFAGIGGIALAAEWAGIETVAFCEREPYCQKLLNQNFPGVPVFDDVRTLNRQLLEDEGVIEPNGTIDIISGGFPCQPYSVAGKRRGTEDDRDLWPEMFRIIKELRPTWVVGENVANFANMELDRTLFDLESAGYKGQSFIIPAVAVGASHRRDRTFVIAYSDCNRCLEHKRQSKTVQSCRKEVLQQEEIGKSIVSKSICSPKIRDVTYSNEQHVERCGETTLQRQHKIQRQLYTRSIEEWSRRSAIYQPKLLGNFNGLPNQVDRIKGLGNAVVPQQIYPIFKAIVDISNRA